MWTQKTASGKIRYFERYTDRSGKSKVVSITLPDAKTSTQRIAREKLMELAKVSPKAGMSISFGEMVERYKAHLRKEFKPQTADAAEYKFRAIIRGIGEETLLKDLTAPFVRDALYDDSASKYNERLKHFKAALRWAYREELMQNIQFLEKLTKKPTGARKAALAEKFLEADELKKLLEGMKVEKWRLLTEFLVLSGLRIGEAIALNQEDVDLTTRQITVNKTFSLVTQKVSLSAKTEAGNRIVSIQNELRACIMRINKTMPRRRTLFFDDDGFVNYAAYSKYFRENTEAIVGRKLSPHALRHTHVALLAAAGIPLDAISRRLGHASSDVTREVYFHVTKKLMEKDAKQLKNVCLL